MPSPARSSPRAPAGSSAGISERAPMISASPSGTLSQKTGRQDSPNRFAVAIAPQATSPATAPDDSTAA
jgi:hypothetical protein